MLLGNTPALTLLLLSRLLLPFHSILSIWLFTLGGKDGFSISDHHVFSTGRKENITHIGFYFWKHLEERSLKKSIKADSIKVSRAGDDQHLHF